MTLTCVYCSRPSINPACRRCTWVIENLAGLDKSIPKGGHEEGSHGEARQMGAGKEGSETGRGALAGRASNRNTGAELSSDKTQGRNKVGRPRTGLAKGTRWSRVNPDYSFLRIAHSGGHSSPSSCSTNHDGGSA